MDARRRDSIETALTRQREREERHRRLAALDDAARLRRLAWRVWDRHREHATHLLEEAVAVRAMAARRDEA